MPKHMCPCGDRLWTRDELIESGDEMARHPAFGCDACCAREVDAYLGGGRMTSPLSREANA